MDTSSQKTYITARATKEINLKWIITSKKHEYRMENWFYLQFNIWWAYVQYIHQVKCDTRHKWYEQPIALQYANEKAKKSGP